LCHSERSEESPQRIDVMGKKSNRKVDMVHNQGNNCLCHSEGSEESPQRIDVMGKKSNRKIDMVHNQDNSCLCHSERSEESPRGYCLTERFFASLRMT
jgi:hypothetical protein